MLLGSYYIVATWLLCCYVAMLDEYLARHVKVVSKVVGGCSNAEIKPLLVCEEI